MQNAANRERVPQGFHKLSNGFPPHFTIEPFLSVSSPFFFIGKISTGPEKPLITLLYRFKESLLFWRENLAPHHKGTCRFNRP